MSAVPPAPNDVYAVFAGQLDQNATQRIFQGVAAAMQRSVGRIHLLLQSTGGWVGEGVCLYNFFSALQIDLILYNVGSIQSIATIAYLGAKKRKASAYATFMIHKTRLSPQSATSEALQTMADSARIDDERTETILREHLTIPEDKWAVHKVSDLWFTAKEAVAFGLATEIGEFAPPVGSPIFAV